MFLVCLTLCSSVIEQTRAYAQAEQDRSVTVENRPMIGSPKDTMNYSGAEKIILVNFPDILYLSFQQRADIEAILTKEQEVTDKYIQKNRQLVEELKKTSLRENEKSKIQKNIKKNDRKIKQKAGKSNKKIKKILIKEQYRVFIEKRDEFRFQKAPSM